MTIAPGETCYTLGAASCSGVGLVWTQAELDNAIAGPVAALVFDDAGAANLAALLGSVADTEFAQDELTRVLQPSADIENWRVGEAIAESYLLDHRGCSFPWPDGRDERKSGSSLPGADLVGFHKQGGGDRFTFGEVKTSGEATYPPQTMYGRYGLIQQLEDLRDNVYLRNDLVKYLGHRAAADPWQEQYRAAGRRYLANSHDVQLFGVLVRDVPPHQDDLRTRVERLATGRPDGTGIEMLCIYLPATSIDSLAPTTLATRAGGGP